MLPQKYAKTAGFSRYSSSTLNRRKWLLCSVVVVAVVFLRSLHWWSCFEVPFRRMLSDHKQKVGRIRFDFCRLITGCSETLQGDAGVLAELDFKQKEQWPEPSGSGDETGFVKALRSGLLSFHMQLFGESRARLLKGSLPRSIELIVNDRFEFSIRNRSYDTHSVDMIFRGPAYDETGGSFNS
jgi:hypothetical protein